MSDQSVARNVSNAIASDSWVPQPLYGGLKKAERLLAPNRTWRSKVGSEFQRRFLSRFRDAIADIVHLDPDEFKCKIAEKANYISDWFGCHQCQIKLNDNPPGTFCAGAIVRLFAEWDVAGTTLDEFRLANGVTTPGVEMTSESFTAYESSKHDHPIAGIYANNGSTWYLTKATNVLTGLDLFDRVIDLNDSRTPQRTGTLRFPKVDFEQMLAPELKGIWILDREGNRWALDQCVQQTLVKMNHLGVGIAGRARIPLRYISSPESGVDVLVDSPAILWITKPECKLPIFSALLGYDSFKDPR